MRVISRKPTTVLVNFKKGRRPLTEKEAQKEHFKNRYFERVGCILTEEKYNDLKNSIQKQGKFLHPGEKGGVYMIPFGGIYLKIVYNFKTQTLITVLP